MLLIYHFRSVCVFYLILFTLLWSFERTIFISCNFRFSVSVNSSKCNMWVWMMYYKENKLLIFPLLYRCIRLIKCKLIESVHVFFLIYYFNGYCTSQIRSLFSIWMYLVLHWSYRTRRWGWTNENIATSTSHCNTIECIWTYSCRYWEQNVKRK